MALQKSDEAALLGVITLILLILSGIALDSSRTFLLTGEWVIWVFWSLAFLSWASFGVASTYYIFALVKNRDRTKLSHFLGWLSIVGVGYLSYSYYVMTNYL